MTNQLRHPDELRPGDVLLCFSDPTKDPIARLIQIATGSTFCHAAIFYGHGQAAESRSKDGWEKGQIDTVDVDTLLKRYDHIAVIRHPDAWTPPVRIIELQRFIDEAVARGAGYNLPGALGLRSRRQAHQDEVLEKLSAYHANTLQPLSENKDQYFCSEFVCDCFVAVGFLDPSAAVAYQSDTYSPGDLAQDPTFGTFWGYLATDPNYAIPASDAFFHATTFDEIFGQAT